MKLTHDYAQPELDLMVEAVDARITSLTVMWLDSQRTKGRGHTNTILASRKLAVAKCLLEDLKKDVAEAKRNPQRATGTYEGSSAGAQVADEMPLVYGRPRASKVGERR